MSVGKKRVLRFINGFLIIVVALGLMSMFYSAYNGDRYRLAQQELKAIVYFCMIILTTNMTYSVTYRMKKSIKYCVAVLILIFHMLATFVLNNLLHYLGFATYFYDNMDVSLIQFCLEDLKYGVYRYISIPIVGMCVYYIIDKEVYKLLTCLLKKVVAFVAVHSKLLLLTDDIEKDDSNKSEEQKDNV